MRKLIEGCQKICNCRVEVTTVATLAPEIHDEDCNWRLIFTMPHQGVILMFLSGMMWSEELMQRITSFAEETTQAVLDDFSSIVES